MDCLEQKFELQLLPFNPAFTKKNLSNDLITPKPEQRKATIIYHHLPSASASWASTNDWNSCRNVSLQSSTSASSGATELKNLSSSLPTLSSSSSPSATTPISSSSSSSASASASVSSSTHSEIYEIKNLSSKKPTKTTLIPTKATSTARTTNINIFNNNNNSSSCSSSSNHKKHSMWHATNANGVNSCCCHHDCWEQENFNEKQTKTTTRMTTSTTPSMTFLATKPINQATEPTVTTTTLPMCRQLPQQQQLFNKNNKLQQSITKNSLITTTTTTTTPINTTSFNLNKNIHQNSHYNNNYNNNSSNNRLNHGFNINKNGNIFKINNNSSKNNKKIILKMQRYNDFTSAMHRVPTIVVSSETQLKENKNNIHLNEIDSLEPVSSLFNSKPLNKIKCSSSSCLSRNETPLTEDDTTCLNCIYKCKNLQFNKSSDLVCSPNNYNNYLFNYNKLYTIQSNANENETNFDSKFDFEVDLDLDLDWDLMERKSDSHQQEQQLIHQSEKAFGLEKCHLTCNKSALSNQILLFDTKDDKNCNANHRNGKSEDGNLEMMHKLPGIYGKSNMADVANGRLNQIQRNLQKNIRNSQTTKTLNFRCFKSYNRVVKANDQVTNAKAKLYSLPANLEDKDNDKDKNKNEDISNSDGDFSFSNSLSQYNKNSSHNVNINLKCDDNDNAKNDDDDIKASGKDSKASSRAEKMAVGLSTETLCMKRKSRRRKSRTLNVLDLYSILWFLFCNILDLMRRHVLKNLWHDMTVRSQVAKTFATSKWLLCLMLVSMMITSGNCYGGRGDVATNCTFPARWEGSWFLSGYQQSIHIKGSQFSYRGRCAASEGNKYLIVDEKGCHRCLVIYEKHKNVLQYKESECEGDSIYQSNPSALAMRSVLKQSDHRGGAHPNLNGHSRLSSSDQFILRSNDDMNDYFCKGRETLQNLCDQIPGDALLYSLFRENAEAVKCPLKGPFIFTYNRGHGECKSPVSNIESCTEDSRLLLSFQACPDVQGTESTVEELTCLATWKDGNSRYLVGLVSHHHAISNEERYRCFVYEKISPLLGGPSMMNPKDAEYKLAQSGDATCNGLDSAEVGSRIMSLRKPPITERCDFPVWFKGPRHWHGLMGNFVYNYHTNDGSIHVIKPNGYMETRALCEQINKQTSTEMMAVVHYTTGCQSGFMCMMFYRRDTHVIEIQSGKPAGRLEDACAPDHFDVHRMPYITLLASNPDPQICPMEGLYNLRGAIGPPYMTTRHKRNHSNKIHTGHGHHHVNEERNDSNHGLLHKKHSSLSFRNADKSVEQSSWHGTTRGLSVRNRRSPQINAASEGRILINTGIVNDTAIDLILRNRRNTPVCVTNVNSQRQLWVGCTEPNVIDVRPLCNDEGDEEYSCHGSWSDNGTIHIVARHKGTKHGVCVSYRPTEGNSAKLYIGDTCYRGTQKPPDHILEANLSIYGKCGETHSRSSALTSSNGILLLSMSFVIILFSQVESRR